ncbi:RHS repeat-associated core domain-containing protein [Pseudomonas putida]|uniref:RHS repeat-associated core domain-containing protein n=1 Tax=Pseudomonas putida TaxID=303 RepID=UPI003905EED4
MQQSQKQIYFYAPEGLSLVKYVGAEASALVRAAGRTLAQRDDVQAALYAADLQGSVQGCIGRNATNLMHYTAYGWDSQNTDASALLRFTGQRKDTLTGHYLLGDGYRAFSPVLMRFNAPDSLSPFGDGGANAYCYCKGDPVNKVDPSGHVPTGHVDYPPSSFIAGGLFTKRWGLRSAASYQWGQKAPALKTLGVQKAVDEFDSTLPARIKHAKRNQSWHPNDVQRLKRAAGWFQSRANRFNLAVKHFEKERLPVDTQAARETLQEVLSIKQWVDRHLVAAKGFLEKRELFEALPFSEVTEKVPNIRKSG